MLWPHYPLHYLMTRPYSREVYKDYQAYLRGPQTAEQLKTLGLDPVFKWLQTQNFQKDDIQTFTKEVQGIKAWLDWAANGQTLYTIRKELTHAFERSDTGDMRLEDVLGSTFFSIYMHFEGPLQQPIKLAEGLCDFEGAYLIYAPGISLRVVLCGRIDPAQPMKTRCLERYDLKIDARHFSLPADTALDLALADDLADIRKAQAQIGRSPAFQYQADEIAQGLRAGHPAFKKALQLTLNALAYLKAYPEDQEDGWTPGAPERLVRAATQGSPTERTRANSKLWSLGHIPVHCLGASFAHSNPEHRGVSMHWRQGHWRHQPYGPAHSLRKLIWVAPTRVGAGARQE